MKRGKYSDDKYSRDLSHLKPDYLPAAKEDSFFTNFDNIKWDDPKPMDEPREGYRVIRGKARESKTSRDLYVKETVNAARTPITERKGLTGEDTFKHVS